MNRTRIFVLLFLVTGFIFAQKPLNKGLATINRVSAEAYVSFLASDALEGRQAGKNGGYVASEYIKATLQDMGIAPFQGDYFYPFEAYSPERQKRVRYSVHPDSIAKYSQLRAHRKLSMRNVLGWIEGKNANEYVVIGAHLDHLGMDADLNGDKIYNGADDNASGVSAVLQIAKAFVASGVKPQRSIIFAFWDGEELGLLGSEHFMLTSPYVKQIRGYLNFDMIGRNADDSNTNINRVVYFYTENNSAFGNWTKDNIKRYKLDLDPDYRPWFEPVGGSDNGSFAKRDIPIMWYHTNGHSDYHQPTDHADQINWNKLVEITKSAYLNLWNLANVKDY